MTRRKLCFAKLAAGLALSITMTTGFAQDAKISLPNWMANVPDSTPLSTLTIPGTHDSGAMLEPLPGTLKCQSLTLSEQLEIGVRYLDIRLRHVNNSFAVHHGPAYQKISFEDVLRQLTTFLKAHPTEMVLVEVSSEFTPVGNTRTFEESFQAESTQTAYKQFFWRETYLPSVGEGRGKIVLLRRFKGSPEISGGIDVTNWPDNTRFTIQDSKQAPITVQDAYEIDPVTNDKKWSAIQSMLDDSPANPKTLHLNFTSGYRMKAGLSNIPSVADDINQRLLNYFKDRKLSKSHHGVIISDFITKELVTAELADLAERIR